MNWLTSPTHRRWLDAEMVGLLEFGRASRHPDGGFGWLDNAGVIDTSEDLQLWITCRMTHVYALATLAGIPGAAALVDHGIEALAGRFHDDEHGGWFASVGKKKPVNTAKEAYGHAFVILAASSATAALRPGALELLEDALSISTEHFWDDLDGMVHDSFDREWKAPDAYHGVNANMHTVEAYCSVADVVGQHEYARRALRICTRVVSVYAQGNSWRIPEHFDEAWMADLDYNKKSPADPFRPYGATIGHGFEWARLTAQLAQTLQQVGLASPEWMMPAARSLYDTAVRDGWGVDGADGFVYTVDWEGKPVVHERMHWVAAEAIGAAATLWAATRVPRYAEDYRRWWDYVGAYHRDTTSGSWWHELDASNSLSHTVWQGKPDIYHAVQATLFPRLPVSPSLASSLAAGNLN